jgi:hypothetical protein
MHKWLTPADLYSRWNINQCDLVDIVNGGKLQSFLGDDFSVLYIVDGGSYIETPDGNTSILRQKPLTVEEVTKLVFLISDVEKFERENGICPHSTIKTEGGGKEPTISKKDQESFIRSLQVSYVSNTEISIRGGGKDAKVYTCGKMGFKEDSKTWQLFMKVLHSPDHKYRVGIYSANKDPIQNRNYNKLVKQLSNFSKKFISFLNDEYSASLPESFNVFENRKGYDRSGTYQPIFQIVDKPDTIQSSDIKNMSEKETIKKLEALSEQRKHEKDVSERDRLLIEIGNYAEHAKKKGWITTKEQLQNLLPPPDEDASTEDAMSLAEPVEDIENF